MNTYITHSSYKSIFVVFPICGELSFFKNVADVTKEEIGFSIPGASGRIQVQEGRFYEVILQSVKNQNSKIKNISQDEPRKMLKDFLK